MEAQQQASRRPLPRANNNNESCACGTKWRDAIQRIRYDIIGKFLRIVAHHAATHPFSYIVIIVMLSFGIAITGLFTNFYLDASDYDQWTPMGSYPEQHRDWYRHESGFTTQWRSTAMLIHRNDGSNIATLEGLEFAFDSLDVLQSVPGYDEICGVKYNCYLTGVTKFWDNNSTLFSERIENNPNFIDTISQKVYPDGYPVDFQREFGNPGMLWDGDLVFVQAFALMMLVRASDEAEEMEKGFADAIVAFQEEIKRKGSEFAVQIYTDRGFTDEFTRGILADLPLIPVAFILMSLFTMIAFTKRHPVLSRSMLGLGAVCCVFFSIITGFGLMFCIGVSFASMNQILPFILFGIGLDDAFILLSAFVRTDPKKDVVERIDETIGDVGSSIALTTITSSLAFGLGAFSGIPAVQYLCHYAYTTILIIFFYQITFFVALLVLDERRIQANRRNCLPCWFSTYTVNAYDYAAAVSSNSKKKKLQKQEDYNSVQERLGLVDCDSNDTDRVDNTANHNKSGGDDDDDDNNSVVDRAHITDRMMVWYAKKLLQPWVKFAVLCLFCVWFGLCLYSASELTQEFEFTDVLPTDSFLVGFVRKAEEYSEALSPFPSAFFRCVDQSDPRIQEQMIKYVDDLVNGLDEISEPPLFFWLRDFKDFISNNEDDNGLAHLPFNEQLDLFLEKPIYHQLYDHVIVRDEISGDIITSSTVLIIDNVDQEDVDGVVAALEKQRQITMNQPINTVRGSSDRIVNAPYCRGTDETDFAFFLYHEQFQNWEFYSVAVYELILSTITGIIAVTIVGMLLVPHWTAGLFVLPLICILYIDVLGILQFAGAHINAVTYVSMIMSIGLMVDFIMHVMLRYYECDSRLSRHEKVIETLGTMGSSVLLGGTSSLIGVLPLWGTTSPLIQTIFKAFMTLVVVGLSHGLIFLPVVLSVIGPLDTLPSSSWSSNSSCGSNGSGGATVDKDHLHKQEKQKQVQWKKKMHEAEEEEKEEEGLQLLQYQQIYELQQLQQQQVEELQRLHQQHEQQLLQLQQPQQPEEL